MSEQTSPSTGPAAVQQRDLWIPTRDGTCLHARVWCPADAASHPVPALLEYLPYRLDDWTAPRDAERHPWYAAHGYASVRVDIRGTGSSGGLFTDEYSVQELDDALDVIDWLAGQPWCTGRVGMFGISWGGFNALQVAALDPGPLAAVVTVCSSDDRYDNDVHYTGGAVLGIDMAAWAGTMLAFTARPPHPTVVGEDWLPMWRDRLAGATPPGATWFAHQERDDYWRHGSVGEDYPAIRTPVLAVGGWADPYRDTVLRLVDHLEAPVRGIVGPWAHQYPDRGLPPGPAIGFLQESLRWWDHWLKDDDRGVLEDPPLRAWVSDSVRPATTYAHRPGRWVGVSWPSPRVVPTTHALASASSSVPVRGDLVRVDTPQHAGIDSGRFFPFGNATDLPPDQRAEDGRSVALDLPVLQEPLEVLGRVGVRLRVRAHGPRGHVVVRLCDVAPDGSSTLVTRGVLNLMSRHGRERADLWPTGATEDVALELSATGHVFPEGHTVRVAISSTSWPWVWPHGGDGSFDVDLAHSAVDLPVLTTSAAERHDDDRIAFEEPVHAEPLGVRALPAPGAARPQRAVRHDVGTGEWVLEVDPGYGGSRRYPDGLVFTEETTETYRIRDGDPLSASTESRWRIGLRRGDWAVRVDTLSTVRADAESFWLSDHVRAVRLGDDDEELEVVSDRSWEHRVPRTSA